MSDDDEKTTGGVNIQGSDVRIGGDVVGGDKVVHGDEVGGDKITVGDVSGAGVAIGRNASASVQTGGGIDTAALAELFKEIYAKVEARPLDENVDKEEIAGEVKKVETEIVKGEAANPNKVERWLKNLAQMAPDIFDVTVKTMISPAAGITEVIRKIAAKAQQEAGASGR